MLTPVFYYKHFEGLCSGCFYSITYLASIYFPHLLLHYISKFRLLEVFVSITVAAADSCVCLCAGDPGGVFRPVCPDRCVQPADQRRGQSGAGAAAEETHRPQGLDHGCAGVPCRSGEFRTSALSALTPDLLTNISSASLLRLARSVSTRPCHMQPFVCAFCGYH